VQVVALSRGGNCQALSFKVVNPAVNQCLEYGHACVVLVFGGYEIPVRVSVIGPFDHVA
jgi:hypothetical protein